MEKLKHSKIGILSFIFSLIPILYIFIQTFIDIFVPIKVEEFNESKGISSALLIMSLMVLISFISFILGIISITKKETKKGLPITAVIISGGILLIPVIGFVLGFIEVLIM